MDMVVEEVADEEKFNTTVRRNALWIKMVIVGHMVFASRVTTLVKLVLPRNPSTKKRRHKTTPLEVSDTIIIINLSENNRRIMMVTLI